MGARLDPGYKMQDNLFEGDVFIGSIMNFYERVRGKPIEKLRFPTKIQNILYGKLYILNSYGGYSLYFLSF